MLKWLHSVKLITYEGKERVATITLKRPDKRAALPPQWMKELRLAFFGSDDSTNDSAMVLPGAGEDFCAGYDLEGVYADRKAQEEASAADPDVPTYRSLIPTCEADCWHLERTQQDLIAMFDLRKPVIAKVHGNCPAEGADVVLVCDMMLCAKDARMGFPVTRDNATPHIHWWIQHLGPQWAKRMWMAGDRLWGRGAARLGLVLDAVPADHVDAEAAELAQRVSWVNVDWLSAHQRVVILALERQGSGQEAAGSSGRNGCAGPSGQRAGSRTFQAQHGATRTQDSAEEPRCTFRRRNAHAAHRT